MSRIDSYLRSAAASDAERGVGTWPVHPMACPERGLQPLETVLLGLETVLLGTVLGTGDSDGPRMGVMGHGSGQAMGLRPTPAAGQRQGILHQCMESVPH